MILFGEDGDVGKQVFDFLLGEEAFCGDEHFLSVYVVGVDAAKAGLKFFDLGGEIPIGEADEGWALEEAFAGTVDSVALGAIPFEVVFSDFGITSECILRGGGWNRGE